MCAGSMRLARPTRRAIGHRGRTAIGGTPVTSFTVPQTGGAAWALVAGQHRLIFGDGVGSICDPATSSYGPTEWDKPCTPATRPITITAKVWRTALGRVQVDFSPALRFVPT